MEARCSRAATGELQLDDLGLLQVHGREGPV